MTLLLRGIGRLLPMTGPVVPAAALLARDGLVAWTGRECDLPADLAWRSDVEEVDVGGTAVVPGFVDCHTHAVFAGVRREEFVARLAGVPYDGGGIGRTVAATRAAGTDELVALAADRIEAAAAGGTTTMEVKTGYGLSPEHELRLLEVIGALRGRVPVRLEATYLGAHVVPEGRERGAYVDEVLATLPSTRERGARWADVFCDRGIFTVDDARRVLTRARAEGLGLRLHAEQLARTGGAALAAELRCASADHLEHVRPADARALAAAGVVGVLLPTVGLSLRSHAWEHAAVLRDAGVELALGTDCNPGTSWCESMPYVISLACLAMGLTVDEAFRAATLGAAHSLRRDDIGHLGVGARADLAVLAAEHEADVVAHLGARAVSATFVGGYRVAGEVSR